MFADLPDPRIGTANEPHPLTDILVVATCATIFRRFLTPPHGVPSHDTFERVFAKLDPDALAGRFGRWMARLGESAGRVHVAIDGKSARRSATGTFTGCPHPVEAWAVESRRILGQRSVPGGGHEITAVPGLLSAPDLMGAVVTLGAGLCQKAIVEQVRRQGGDYVARVKGNQRGLRGAVAGVPERAGEAEFADCDAASEVGAAHGRTEGRYATVVHDPEGLPAGWAAVGAAARMCRERRAKGTTSESGPWYDLASLRVSAEALGGHIRNRWGIESGLHWRLGVSPREDERRTRAGRAAANLARVRRVAPPLLKRAGTEGGIQTRRGRAAWDDDYLLAVLQGIQANQVRTPWGAARHLHVASRYKC